MKLCKELRDAFTLEYGCTKEQFSNYYTIYTYTGKNYSVSFFFDLGTGEYMFTKYYTEDYPEGFEYFGKDMFTKKLRTEMKITFAEMFMIMTMKGERI